MATLIIELTGHGTWGLIAASALGCALVCLLICGAILAVIDARTHRLPNIWVVRLSVGVAGFLTIASGSSMAAGEPLGWRWALAALAAGLVFLALRWLTLRGLGMGDVKLAPALAAIAAVASWGHVLLAGVLMCLVAGLHALTVMIATRNPRAHIAFGPAMIVGTTIVLCL